LTDIRIPRPVYCSTWHLHHNLTVARDICAGRFTHAGTTVTISGQPDWTRPDLHAVSDWWAEWVEFPYTLDLAFAFHKTGDPRYLYKWKRLVGSWAADMAPDFGPVDAVARRVQNWLYSWVALEDSLSFIPLEPIIRDTIAESISRQAKHLLGQVARSGYRRTAHLSALLVVALALPDAPGADGLREYAWPELQRSVLADFDPNGRHRERTGHHSAIALRSLLAARENARRFGLPVDPGFEHRLKAALDFSLHVPVPRLPVAAVPPQTMYAGEWQS
jgi:Heparinase II/III N-terminus